MNTLNLVFGQETFALSCYTGIINWTSPYLKHLNRVIYYKNGVFHREDGPAVTFHDGGVQWYLEGKIYSKEKWFDLLTPEQKIKALFIVENFS